MQESTKNPFVEALLKGASIMRASNHLTSCRCSDCLIWWTHYGPVAQDDETWSTGPFTPEEFLDAGGIIPTVTPKELLGSQARDDEGEATNMIEIDETGPHSIDVTLTFESSPPYRFRFSKTPRSELIVRLLNETDEFDQVSSDEVVVLRLVGDGPQ